MPKFQYRAVNAVGEEYVKTTDAADRFAVYDQVRTDGGKILSVEEVGKGFSIKFDPNKIMQYLSRVSIDEKTMFARNLGAMTKAGLPLSRALSISMRQTKNQKLISVFQSIIEDIDKGSPFHMALAKFPAIFPRIFIAMVKAGEESGGMADALFNLAEQMERTSNLKKKIKGALIYPCVILTVMVGIGILMMIYVVPTLTATFEELHVELPTTTKVVIGTSKFLTGYPLVALVILVGIPFGVASFFRTRIGKRMLDIGILYIPVIGTLVKEANAARMARTLSSLLAAGVDVVNALSITGEVVQNVRHRAVLKVAEANVQKGKPLSEAFIEREDAYPILVGEMISVGEETGEISGMLLQVAHFYETEVEQKTKDMSTIIEPFLMVAIGGGVGFFALAMIAPIYSLSDSIG